MDHLGIQNSWILSYLFYSISLPFFLCKQISIFFNKNIFFFLSKKFNTTIKYKLIKHVFNEIPLTKCKLVDLNMVKTCKAMCINSALNMSSTSLCVHGNCMLTVLVVVGVVVGLKQRKNDKRWGKK